MSRTISLEVQNNIPRYVCIPSGNFAAFSATDFVAHFTEVRLEWQMFIQN
jgi:hypothetical protein